MIKQNKDNWIEVINNDPIRGDFKSALFDFDGTLSLIREGWREVMVSYFVDVLKKTPKAEDEKHLRSIVMDFVDYHTGKQTIYQCISLNEEVKKRSGKDIDPLEYKREYHKRLIDRIKHRLVDLEEGKVDKEDMIVPGALDFLKKLKDRDIALYLASGTDEKYVLNEVRLLGLSDFFDGGIYGAIDQYKLFSKSKIVAKIIDSNSLRGHELVGFGDGFVEIENVKEAGGLAVGVATNEKERQGVNSWKRERLIKAGADIIIPDFSDPGLLEEYLFEDGK